MSGFDPYGKYRRGKSLNVASCDRISPIARMVVALALSILIHAAMIIAIVGLTRTSQQASPSDNRYLYYYYVRRTWYWRIRWRESGKVRSRASVAFA